MGVLGLYSYFDSKALGQRRSWTTPPSSQVSDVASNGTPNQQFTNCDSDDSGHRSGSGSGSESGSQSGTCPPPGWQERYFILDGNAYIHHLYCGQFEWIWGGQYSSFANLLTAHITALRDCGFQLQILFDGPLPLQKLQTRLTRDTEKIQKMSKVMSDLEHYHVLGLSHHNHHHHHPSRGILISGDPEGSLDLLANRAGGAGGRGSSYFLIPPLVMEVTLQTLRSLGVDMMVCDGEADGLVAQLAMERSMDENVSEAYAVSKDSDYFIYNTGSSTKGGYIPLDSFFVSNDPRTKITTIMATVYSQAVIAHHLGIRPEFLPLFASLTGNDYLRPEAFEDQIARSLANTTGQKLSGTSNANHTRIKATAGFLKQYGAGSEAVVVGKKGTTKGNMATHEHVEVIRVMEQILDDRKQLYSGETNEKRKELRAALEESMQQYSTIIISNTSEGRRGCLIVSNVTSTTHSGTTISGLDKMKEAFRSGQFSFKLMDVVYNKMFWCTPFLEDTDRESAWLVTREMRRWIYGILARNLITEAPMQSNLSEADHELSHFDVIEYVRRGDHLSAEKVTNVSRLELDEVLKSARAKANEKSARRMSVMDMGSISLETHDQGSNNEEDQDKAETMSIDMNLEDTDSSVEDNLDEASRTNLFLAILGAYTAQTRSASISIANFEVIAFVASVLFLREKYYPKSIPVSAANVCSSYCGGDQQKQQQQQQQPQQQQQANSVLSIASISLSGSTTLDEAPPLTKRSIHLSSQYQYALAAVSFLANALHLEDMMPSLAVLFDGLLFQQTLALARGGTLLEQRMQYPESVTMYHRVLAAVEENFIDTGEIDVVVVFRAPSGKKGHQSQQQQQEQRVSLGIFGPDIEPVNYLSPTPSSSSASSSSSSSSPSPSPSQSTSIAGSSSPSWKPVKSAGIHKKSSGTSKKRQGGSGGSGSGTSHNSNHNGGGRGGGGRGGGNANMFSVLSLGCEF
ncbi:hypothetical protein BGZ65_000136 [Modicella reniformis]|uniref:Asteroid domain-containing protein n=1 Tax=Modicella reniformis TaxID=1440133 RepID=A0A9P6MLU1_9FUNG|nr:hypothetical protein BGZ65_000136 [Modicella reniformis]